MSYLLINEKKSNNSLTKNVQKGSTVERIYLEILARDDLDTASAGCEVATLPVLGESYWKDEVPADQPPTGECQLRVTNIRRTAVHGDDSITRRYKYVVSYTSAAERMDAYNNGSVSRYAGFYNKIGGESIALESTVSSPWTWASDSTSLEQPIAKFVGLGTVTVETYCSPTDWPSLLGQIKQAAGKLNLVAYTPSTLIVQDAFVGFKKGQLLFSGVSGARRMSTAKGEELYAVSLDFSYRLIDDDSVTEDDWQYIWRKETGAWDKPKLGTPPDYLYEYYEFMNMWDYIPDERGNP